MPTLSVCNAPGCPVLVTGRYCAEHDRTSSRNHRGIPRQARGHGAVYERERAALLGKPCHWCGAPADTADYRIPVSQGGTLADLVPACRHCNYARGAALARQAFA
jgi:5-methylcytosine-specific restriction endonuclease McrA